MSLHHGYKAAHCPSLEAAAHQLSSLVCSSFSALLVCCPRFSLFLSVEWREKKTARFASGSHPVPWCVIVLTLVLHYEISAPFLE